MGAWCAFTRSNRRSLVRLICGLTAQWEIAFMRFVYCHQLFIHTIILSPCVRNVWRFFSSCCWRQWSLIGFEWSAIACCAVARWTRRSQTNAAGQANYIRCLAAWLPGSEPNCSRFVAASRPSPIATHPRPYSAQLWASNDRLERFCTLQLHNKSKLDKLTSKWPSRILIIEYCWLLPVSLLFNAFQIVAMPAEVCVCVFVSVILDCL